MMRFSIALVAAATIATACSSGSGLGEACDGRESCTSEYVCHEGFCRQPCNNDDACELTEACNNGLCLTVSAPPSPTGLAALAGDSRVSVTWSSVPSADSYKLYWSVSAGVSRASNSVPVPTASYEHAGLTNGTSYHYKVSAINRGGESELSAEASATPGVLVPGNLTARAGVGKAIVTWEDVEGAGTYNLYWSLASGVTTSDNAIPDVTSPYVHSPLDVGVEYFYAVSSVVDGIETSLSEEVSAAPVASLPYNLQAEASNASVTLTWSSISGASRYSVYWSFTPPVTTGSSRRVAGASTSHVHSSLANGMTYFYAVSAVDESIGYEYDLSAVVSATPQLPPPPNLAAIAQSRQVTLTWGAVTGAGEYRLYWADSPGVNTGSAQIADVTSPYVHSPLSNGTQYYYALSAVDATTASEGALSTETSAVPDFSNETAIKWLAPDAEANDRFGISVDISGSYAIVGARGEDSMGDAAGAAYVFHRSGTSGWDAGAKLVASDAEAFDLLGESVAISGDYAVAGARGQDIGNADPFDAGAAYVFRRVGTNDWDSGAKLVAQDAQAGDSLGCSVAIDGDYVVVGAYLEDGGTGDLVANSGAAYVFHRVGQTAWDSGAKLLAPGAQAYDNFGWSVAIDGDYAIVGAYREDGASDLTPDGGAAYVFHRTDTNTWDEGTKLTAVDGAQDDQFGYSVGISGDYAVVGALNQDHGNDDSSNFGAAYVFHRTGVNAWEHFNKLVAGDAESGDGFGDSVAIDGGSLVVGTPYEDGDTGDPDFNSGAVYLFRFDATTEWWVERAKLVAPDAQLGDILGFAGVAIDQDYVIVGARDQDGAASNPLSNTGAAYVF